MPNWPDNRPEKGYCPRPRVVSPWTRASLSPSAPPLAQALPGPKVCPNCGYRPQSDGVLTCFRCSCATGAVVALVPLKE